MLLWPAPSLYAWAEGNISKRVYWSNLSIGWFPPFWPMVWWLAIFPPWLERRTEELKRELEERKSPCHLVEIAL